MIVKAIIEARMTSTRLPGKVILPILGRPTLELLIERLQRSQCLDGIVVATTTNSTDDVLEALSAKLGVECFRGSEEDVLGRVLGAARASHTELIVEITGDCPLVDPAIVDQLIGIYRANRYDYVSNTLKRTYPRGLDVQVFSTATLGEVAGLTDDPADHEHVSLYIYEHPERFRLFNLESGLPERYGDLRLTVDTPEDFALIQGIYERLYPDNPTFAMDHVLALLDQHPDLLELNRHIRQKAVR